MTSTLIKFYFFQKDLPEGELPESNKKKRRIKKKEKSESQWDEADNKNDCVLVTCGVCCEALGAIIGAIFDAL